MKIISGGQTGVDRAALDVALELKIPCGGWCPLGRLAEDGRIDDRYPLKETSSEIYAQRTRWNVRDSDATLLLMWGKLSSGTKLTYEIAIKMKKAPLVVDMLQEKNPQNIYDWIQKNKVEVLNIAGSRETSKSEKIYLEAYDLLKKVFTL